MPDLTVETDLLEHFAVLIATLEFAHELSERAAGLVDAGRPVELARTLGGVDALLTLAAHHRDRALEASRSL